MTSANSCFRKPAVVLSLDGRRHVYRVTIRSWLFIGRLVGIKNDALRVKGWPSGPGEDPLDAWKQSHYDWKYARIQEWRPAPGARYAVNLDPATLSQVRRKIGRVVEITPDCEGRARYVDVFKVNTSYNFTGGNNAYRYVGGSDALHESYGKTRRADTPFCWTSDRVQR